VRVALSTDGVRILLADTEFVRGGIGIDSADTVQFTAHFADFNHCY